jgi:hypothetical protein
MRFERFTEFANGINRMIDGIFSNGSSERVPEERVEPLNGNEGYATLNFLVQDAINHGIGKNGGSFKIKWLVAEDFSECSARYTKEQTLEYLRKFFSPRDGYIPRDFQGTVISDENGGKEIEMRSYLGDTPSGLKKRLSYHAILSFKMPKIDKV